MPNFTAIPVRRRVRRQTPDQVRYPMSRVASRRHGMGDDWGGAVAGMIAGDELDKLVSAILDLNDQLVDMINSRASVLAGYAQAKTTYDQALQNFAGFDIGDLEPVQLALGTAKKGVQVYARQVQTLTMLDHVFTDISNALVNAGLKNDASNVDATLNQIRRFTIDTDNAFSRIPEYMDAKRAILGDAQARWSANHVMSNAYSDPNWFALYVKAADAVVPLPNQPELPAELRAAGMGALPLIASMLIWVIGVVVAGVVISKALARAIPDQNSKAETVKQILLKAADEKARVRSEMMADGKSQAEIDAAMESIDRGAAQASKDVPDAPSMMGYILIPLGLGIGGIILAKFLKVF